MSRKSVQYTSSPLLASKTPIWRSQFIVAAIALGFLGLVVRAAYVQVIDNAFFKRQGTVRFVRSVDIPADRGKILDRNGAILASSVSMPSIFASPEEIEREPSKLKALAKAIDMPLAELQTKIKNEEKGFVWLKRMVDESVEQHVRDLKIKGVGVRKEYKRIYPEGEAVAHVVGFTNIENEGQEGVELTFEKELTGRNGSRRVINNRLGQAVEDMGEIRAPIDGQDLQLSIDSKIQYFAYQKLKEAVIDNKASAGSVVVLDVNTGEVLALGNYPSFVPNNRVNLNGGQLRNRALTDTFEPGSTMKPFVVGLALERGLVQPETIIQTGAGKYNLFGHTISDSSAHGAMSVNEVIQKSSNIGTVKISLQMQPKDLWEIFTQVGFGQKPQVPFPGAVSGKLRAYKTWRPIEQATMSYGYGLSVSLFQLAHAYTIFARDGELIPVSLQKQVERVAGVKVIGAKHSNEIRSMLHMVAGPGGTAPKAQTMGYSVGGKTGTAHKVEGARYAGHKYRGFFVGIAPIEKPRIVVAVMIDEPTNGRYFGGDVAAPVFSQTVQQTLRVMGIQPDMSVKPQVVAKAEVESF
ncbi:MAG: peptidoglycan D,D-transpeptidase FtsI family protein [Burkholderiaceae bacterium]